MTERNHEIARGIRVHKQPDRMTRIEAIMALEDVADYASRLLMEKRTLERVIKNSMNRNHE